MEASRPNNVYRICISWIEQANEDRVHFLSLIRPSTTGKTLHNGLLSEPFEPAIAHVPWLVYSVRFRAILGIPVFEEWSCVLEKLVD